MTDSARRRPLKIRNRLIMQRSAAWLSQRQVTPNQISVMSVVCAAIGAVALVMAGRSVGIPQSLCFVLAALMIQGRLLCNLFDGMVAMEGGKQTPSGELYNDVPDRIADVLFILGCGFALPEYPSAMWLAWSGALLAVMTAYIRVLGVSLGLPADFRGPQAKPHRMALLTGACLVSALEFLWDGQGQVLWIALILLAAGSALTCVLRLRGIHLQLNARA
jgi:phosphatidylglycerophosphate synthase